MARISIADIHLHTSTTFIEELTEREKTKTLGGRLTWEQLCALDEKMYSLNIQQRRLMDNLSDRLDQQMYNEIMGWKLPNNINI
ncbi:MAG: hypothetical protein QNJ51_24470 [Calothrix sp. MO_167.B12]|nr:hypothetical protein [Calothrix sp. MO_167.B12]